MTHRSPRLPPLSLPHVLSHLPIYQDTLPNDFSNAILKYDSGVDENVSAAHVTMQDLEKEPSSVVCCERRPSTAFNDVMD